ncbi:MAG TPA: DEAD/DEAH box helicase [Candidatus Lokiarchaeia archaeon]|nr:DEAD/DEAH box helicase [Candidatus Lokiarchaeia archaeon]
MMTEAKILEKLSKPTVIDVDAEQNIDLSLDFNVQDTRVNAILRQSGMAQLRKIQAVALQHGLFFRQSMLVISPSGSGKTLIGELAAINSIIESFGKAAYLVPLKALATEKYKHFVKCYARLGIKIEISIGDYDLPAEDLVDADLVVMTYEKLDSMLRSSRGLLSGTFGCLVIDEIHVMGEQERGPRLESLIIRASRALGDVQIVALSATVANPTKLNEWLGCLGYDMLLLLSKERPVPLQYEIVIAKENVTSIAEILEHVTADGGQCLVFTRSRKRAEQLAKQLSNASAGGAPATNYQARVELAFKAKRASKYSDLAPLLVKGIAYHHAGLSTQERDLVEHAFIDRLVIAICCTTTLAAGINMPARAVIVEDYKQFQVHEKDVADKKKFMHVKDSPAMFKPIPKNTFHQIVGRAGRAGFDTTGTAYILVHSKDEAKWIEEYYFSRKEDGTLEPAFEPLRSALADRDVMLDQLLVHAHEMQIVSYDGLKAFFSKTFYKYLLGKDDPPIDTMLKIKHVLAKDLLVDLRHLDAFTIKVAEATETRISGILEEKATNRRYECQLTSQGGLSCTCGAKPGSGLSSACVHLRLLIKEVLLSHPIMEHAIDEMLIMALHEECYVDYLVDNGFIEPLANNEYRCTSFGSLVARLYIYPSVAIAFKQAIITRMSSDIAMDPFEPWFFELVHAILDDQDMSRGAGLFAGAWHWIEEESMDVVLEPFRKPVLELRKLGPADDPVYPGDFNNFKNDLQRWARVAGKIAGHLGISLIEVACARLERRIEHGVKGELLPLVENIKGVGRIRGRMIYKAGCKTIDDIQCSDPKVLSEKTGLPEQTCYRIVASAKNCVPIGDQDEEENT